MRIIKEHCTGGGTYYNSRVSRMYEGLDKHPHRIHKIYPINGYNFCLYWYDKGRLTRLYRATPKDKPK